MYLSEIDRYASLASPLHSWDPRTKLVSLSILLVSLVLADKLLVALGGFLLALGLVLLSRIPLRFVFSHLSWVLLPVLFFFIALPLTVPGGRTFRPFFLKISLPGLETAALIGLRALGAVLLILAMVGTMRFEVTLKALKRLKAPGKFVQAVMFSYRYVFLVRDEMRRMSTAAEARLFKKTMHFSSLKSTGNLAGMMFVRSWERSRRIHDAMVSRGYTGSVNTLDEFRLSAKDIAKAGLAVGAAAALAAAGLVS